MDESYRVKLDIYNGPLDLLLYLVYKSEVDIFNIPIADILDQYLLYVEMIKEFDIELAGDFLVLASRLMNIKSKMLMPRPDAEPAGEEIIDPREELVKELLEYREYKEKAYVLQHKMYQREKMFERVPPQETGGAEEPAREVPVEKTNVWDLLLAFHKITKDFMPEVPRKIVYDDTPVSVYVEKLLAKLSAADGRRAAFTSLFAGLAERIQVIGMFLGVLEAVKQGALRVQQIRHGAEIYLELVPEQERTSDAREKKE